MSFSSTKRRFWLLHILHEKKTLRISLILFISSFIIYLISYRGEGRFYNHFALLAKSILDGHFYITEKPTWLNELVDIKNKFYVPFPPMPAILLVPFVFVFGPSFPQPLLSILIGSLNVVLCFIVVKNFFNEKIALLTSILFAFGTIHWYHSEVGSSWYIAHIVAIFFIWLSILEIQTGKRLALIGFLIGLAFLSHEPAIFAIFFPLIYLYKNIWNFKNLLNLFTGLAITLIASALYNFISFGTFYNLGYWLIPNVLNEPWYKYGIVSFRYIPIHLKELFFALPIFENKFPFIIPSINVMAIWFTTPALFLILKANFRNLIEKASAVSIVMILIPILMHGSNGFTQFGYRFMLDFYPFLLILVASGIKNTKNLLVYLLVLLSILINLWGVLMISFFKIWVL